MNRKEAIFELLNGNKVRRLPWGEGFLFMDNGGMVFYTDLRGTKPCDMNTEPYTDWEFAHSEKKATYKDAIKAFSEGKAIRDPDGKIHQLDAYAKENEGECYTIID